VQDTGIESGRPPDVDRPDGSRSVYLTCRGTNDAKVVDRDTRIRIAMPVAQAARLWRELGLVLSNDEVAQ
jgi:hypothetical protein